MTEPAARDRRPTVIQTEHLEREAAAWLGERCRLVRCGVDDPRFEGLLREAEGLVIRTYTIVDEGLLARAPRLRVVGRAGVGLDNVDQAACASRGVVVLNTPSANTRAVVEYVWALVFDALRPRVFLDRALDAEAWNAARRELVAERELSTLTLGIVGFGRIGSRVGRVGAALGMRVVYHDLREIAGRDRHGCEPVDAVRLHAESDVISVHADGRAENAGLIGAGVMGLWKDDVVFINCARGFLVDEGALAGFLVRCPSACAMLDVHASEPVPVSSELLGLANAHLSPHLAAGTRSAQRNMSWVVKDVWGVLTGGVRGGD